MNYLTPTLGDINTILLPELLEGVTFDFKHGFLQMLENNLLLVLPTEILYNT